MLPGRQARVPETVIAAVIAAAAVVVVLAPAVRRGPAFHVYADQRTWLGIPHAGDVLSNLPFIVVGALGLARRPRGLAALVFAGFVAIGLGSGAYHVAPGDTSLAFDWLPIVLTLAWLAGFVIGDRHDAALGRAVAIAGSAAAVAGVAVWWAGGGTAAPGGDMRWYVATQALGVVLVAIAALLPATAHSPAKLDRRWLIAGVAGFLLARLLSSSDQCLLDATGISGHSWKHLALGAAAACVLRGTFAPGARPSPRKGSV
jgi:hypothetical protein